jgi:hypothetical protein
MNLFILAEMQLQRERTKLNFVDMLDRAEKIRHYLDLQERGQAILRAKKKGK